MLTLIIKPTHRCNLNCTYCYDRPNREKDCSLMTHDTLENVFKKASEKTDEISIIWHGGEPTLMGMEWYKKAYEEIIPKYFDMKKVSSAFQTNGTIFDVDLLALCEKYKVDLGMSYDGITNNDTRRNTEKLMLNRAKAQICGFERGWKGFLMVITPENAHTVLESYREAVREGYDLTFSELFMEQTEEEAIKTFDIIIATYKELLKYVLTEEADVRIPRPLDSFIEFILGLNHSNMCENLYCKSGWLGIHPDGTLFPCGRDWPEDYSYGNINTITSLSDIYYTKAYQELMIGDNWTKEHCVNCKQYLLCRGGCPNTKLLIYGNLREQNKAHCHFIRTLHKACIEVLTELKFFEIKNRTFIDKFSQTQYKTYKEFKEKIGAEL